MSKTEYDKKRVLIEDVIIKNPEKVEPCLISFGNGSLVQRDKVVGSIYSNRAATHTRRRKERILKIESESLSYIGKNFGPDASDNKLEKLFLGVLNKDTNKMKLIEMSTFTMHPNLNDQNDKEILVDTTGMTYQEKQKQLSDAFGGRKSRVQLKKRIDNQLKFDSMNDALSSAVKNISIEPINFSSISNNINMYKDVLPPNNRDVPAQNISEVYPLKGMVMDEELLLFNDLSFNLLYSDKIKKEEDEDVIEVSSLMKYIVAIVKASSQSEEESCKRICIALFAEQLIEASKIRGGTRTSKVVFSNCPKVLKTKIFSFISDNRTITQTNIQKDRLLAHIIILLLIACGYQLSLNLLHTQVKVPKERIEMMVRVIGASVTKTSNDIILKLPLISISSNEGKLRKNKKRKF